ncbi:MAG: DUF362 domain-containing protein, partial [bacterium]
MTGKGMEDRRNGTVSLSRCGSYAVDEVERAVRGALEPLGGMGSFVKPKQRVALKPNLLRGADASSAVITHPSVVEAVARLVTEAGGSPFVIDSPGAGIPYVPRALHRLYQRCGYLPLEHAVCLNYDCRTTTVPFAAGRMMKRFDVLSPVIEADVLINLPKVKSHGFTYLSCAVKNLFGVVPGLHKPSYHGRFKDRERFGSMLIDLCLLLAPALTICDGIVGMEGDGPSWGGLRELGLIAASADPFHLDLVICSLIDFDPLRVPYLRQAVHQGICAAEVSAVPLKAPGTLDALRVPFSPPATFDAPGVIDRLRHAFLLGVLCHACGRVLSITPRVDPATCRGCGVCAEACPNRAISMVSGRARINRRRCIRCYCCHELCPHGTVVLRPSWVRKILGALRRAALRR